MVEICAVKHVPFWGFFLHMSCMTVFQLISYMHHSDVKRRVLIGSGFTHGRTVWLQAVLCFFASDFV